MTPEQQAAYIISQTVCALIEAMGMQGSNLAMELGQNFKPYMKADFEALLEKYGIHHNAVISFIQGR